MSVLLVRVELGSGQFFLLLGILCVLVALFLRTRWAAHVRLRRALDAFLKPSQPVHRPARTRMASHSRRGSSARPPEADEGEPPLPQR